MHWRFAAVMLSVLVSGASAQWLRLEFSFTASANSSPELVPEFEMGGAHGWFVFDTERAPIESGPQGIIYEIDAFDVSRFFSRVDSAHSGRLTERDAVARFKAAPDVDFYALQVFDESDNPLASVQVFVDDGGLFAGPTLPGDVASYHSTFAGGSVQFIGIGGIGQVYNDGDFGFRFRVREVAAPEPKPCSEVDLAEPFGVLNFDDVLAFLVEFGAGCD